MKKELAEKLKRIANSNTQYGILMAIKAYGSANIKTLAEVVGKTESTIFHHLVELIKEPKLIEIDQKRTETTRGKYYRLIIDLVEHYRKDDDVHQEIIPGILDKILEMSDDEIYEHGLKTLRETKDLDDIARTAKKSLSYNFMLNNIILNSFDKAANELKKGKVPIRKNIPFPGFSNLSMNLKISTARQVILISKTVNDFFAKLIELRNQFQNEMDELNVKEEDRITSYVQLFSGELGEFPFSYDE
ncbi:MAG: hypothetical protein ACTSXA_10220 [Candidatus Heimdallarchaeota archaeon]